MKKSQFIDTSDRFFQGLRVTANMQEWIIQEIRRSEHVIRIFLDEESALPLLGAYWLKFTKSGDSGAISIWLSSPSARKNAIRNSKKLLQQLTKNYANQTGPNLQQILDLTVQVFSMRRSGYKLRVWS